ncbi:unnamed protein product [Peniophora sp. CBMAI 1063]|nr:unnamed protein product [Peniophora sp. CBMAI 1063]
MLINQYYSAGPSRVTNYYYGPTPTYIPTCAPRPALAHPSPKPTYHYLPPVLPTPRLGAYGGSPVIIINNVTSCRDPPTFTPPVAASPLPVYDEPSYTTTRYLVNGEEIPGMSPYKPVCALGDSTFEAGPPMCSPPSPRPIPSPPTSPPPPPPNALSASHGTNATNQHMFSFPSSRIRSGSSATQTSTRRPLPPTPTASRRRSGSPDGQSDVRDATRTSEPPNQPDRGAAADLQTSSHRRESSTDSTASDPVVEEWRRESRRNTLLNSIRLRHPSLYPNSATRVGRRPSGPQSRARRGYAGESLEHTPQVRIASRRETGPRAETRGKL